jgi:hypothetical protein
MVKMMFRSSASSQRSGESSLFRAALIKVQLTFVLLYMYTYIGQVETPVVSMRPSFVRFSRARVAAVSPTL